MYVPQITAPLQFGVPTTPFEYFINIPQSSAAIYFQQRTKPAAIARNIEVTGMSKVNSQRLGDAAWAKMPRCNSELFTLTYGALVAQLIRDYEDITAVNQQLEKMGHSIGQRIIDEFLSKSGMIGNCSSFRETAEVLAKAAFKMFLGIQAEVTNWNAEGTVFSLVLPSDNPFLDFVELPPQYSELQYCALLCGVIIGALEMVQMKVECRFIRDVLKGDEVSEMRVELKGMMKTEMDAEYKEN